jgi:hypothetical protein
VKKLCAHCGRPLSHEGGVDLCLVCNQLLAPEDAESSKVVIECPGVTLYDVETGAVLQGVKWLDPDNVAVGFEIVGKQMFAQGHVARRVIEAESLGKITRCRACQDYTVRMRALQRDHKVQGPSAARRRAENLFRKEK